MKTTLCTKCNQVKPISEFYKDKKCSANYGVQYHCKECIKEARKIYYDENFVKVNSNVRKYHKLHPGRLYHGPTCNHAQAKLNREVKAGRILKPDLCKKCGEKKRLHAHHWNGYENPLQVIWLCPSCHHAAHGRGPKARQLGAMKSGDFEEVV